MSVLSPQLRALPLEAWASLGYLWVLGLEVAVVGGLSTPCHHHPHPAQETWTRKGSTAKSSCFF